MRIIDAIAKVDERIRQATAACGRQRQEVTLELAVKTQPWERIKEAIDALQELGLPVVLGHNHVQEVVQTSQLIRDYCPQAQIHQIGHLQSNKISAALGRVDLIETVDSPTLLARLSRRLERDYPDQALAVFLEVNVSGEDNKHGISPAQAVDLGGLILDNPRLSLRGLMTVGALHSDREQVQRGFRLLAQLREEIQGLPYPEATAVTELSMGMSGDLELAIASGSTIVRIGTDVFGQRYPSPNSTSTPQA